MGVFRREKAGVPNAVVASARHINLKDPKQAQHARRTTGQAWQHEAWERFDEVPELQSTALWFAWQVSKLRLFPARIHDPALGPQQVDDAPATKAVERLKRPYGTHSPLLWEWALNWFIAGEAFLHGTTLDNGQEKWDIKSVSEVQPTGDGWQLTEDDETGYPRPLDPNKDVIIRLWIRHPRRSSYAISPTLGVLDPAEQLIILSKASRSIARSRMHAGILAIPSELSFGSHDPTQESDPEKDPFLQQLMKALVTPIQEEGTAAAAVPVLVKGPAEYIQHLEFIDIERKFDEYWDQRMEREIRRMSQGMPIPPEILLGTASTSHWNLWKVDDNAWSHYLAPFADAMMDALTMGYLWPSIKISGVEEDPIVVGYDATRVIARPDQSAENKDAHERFVLSDAAYRKRAGISEEEAPSDEELARRTALKRGNIDPFLMEALLKLLLDVKGLDVLRPGGATGEQNEPAPEAAVESPNGPPKETAPLEPSPSHTVPVEDVGASAFYGRLLGACDAACRKALSRAGARLRTRIQKQDQSLTTVIAAAPNFKVAAVLGQDVVERLGMSEEQLIEGSFGDLKEQFHIWTHTARIPAELRASAWSDLQSRLVTVCRHAIYDPPRDLESLIDPVVRECMEELKLWPAVSHRTT